MTSIDINVVLQEIREKVRRRRLDGDYPPGLENQLEAEFERILESTHRDFSVDVEARNHLEEADSAFSRLLKRYETQKDLFEKEKPKRSLRGGNIDPWGFVAPEIIEIEHHVLRALELLNENAARQQDADRRLVTELSQHVLDRVAVIDHLMIIVQELESRLNSLENS